MREMSKKMISFALLVVLMAISLTGCFGLKVPENLLPMAYFTYLPLAPTTDNPVLFTDRSTDEDGTIVSWAWDFGDGSTSTSQNPAHKFSDPRAYRVSLTATDDGGASDTYSATVTVSSAPLVAAIGKQEAIGILMDEILKPASSDERVSAFMLSEPLEKGDVVAPEDSPEFSMDTNTWFIFIDDQPQAFYEHDTRYVFLDTETGDYDVINENWPPLINDESMWDSNPLEGNLIQVYAVLGYPGPVSGVSSEAPLGDYGDAPDGQDAYYQVPGHFPTLYSTANSLFNRPGGHALTTGEEMIGLNVSDEVDALDPSDPDGVPNLVDSDWDDRLFVILDGANARLAVTVTVSPGAPELMRYLNVLIDFDQSGNWSTGNQGSEWAVVNLEVDVDPGNSETIVTPEFPWGNQASLPSPCWMRVALTREKVDESLFSKSGGWDGSGQFDYGEIEDYLAFLTDNPPPPPPPPPPNGGAPPPGPEKGPCGYDINYHVIIISGGDSSKHMAQGLPIVQSSVDRMAKIASEQGYTSIANLSPDKAGDSQTSLANIGKAFDALAQAVKCGDHVLIYICGHGRETGGIALKDSAGRTREVMKPKDEKGDDGKDSTLADFLEKIPPCPDEDCETLGKCCHVSVIIESCYSGNFNVDGVTGEGRAVVGTSTNTVSWANPTGGIYTEGFDKDLRDPDADKSDPPDGVDAMEAHMSASAAVDAFNQQHKTGQKPWQDNQWCECKCPCKPGIDVEKWVWSELGEGWVDMLEAPLDQLVRFRLEIENSGKCRDIIDLELVDSLPYCLVPQYEYPPVIYRNGTELGARPPDQISQGQDGLLLTWNLKEMGALEPGESLAIEYDAITDSSGPNINEISGTAHCAVDYNVVVSDHDAAIVMVTPRPQEPVPEDVLHCYLKISAECWRQGQACYCDVYAYFEAEDLTGGERPVTSVVLKVDGQEWYNSGNISEVFYSTTVSLDALCGETINFEMVARNATGQTVTCTQSIKTPVPPLR